MFLFSQISRLKSHLDNLTKLVEQLRLNQLAVARSRIGSQSTSDMVALPDAYSYRSSSSSVSSPTTAAPALPWNSSSKQESWKMPFTFKCIGTFRYEIFYESCFHVPTKSLGIVVVE